MSWTPDFIIGGAMKSGTTTLRHVLGQHKDVHICPEELFFFDVDNFRQHPEFFGVWAGEWIASDYSVYRSRYRNWYENKFDAGDAQLVGEETSTYLSSEVAADRIHQEDPGMRFIFVLRDPVERCYSQYWHMVRRGQLSGSFEWAIRYGPSSIIDRSIYAGPLRHYRDLFGRKQVAIVIFEQLIREPSSVIENISDYLGVAGLPDDVPKKNPGRYPVSPAIQYVTNSILYKRGLGGISLKTAERPHFSELEPRRQAYRFCTYYLHRIITKVNCIKKGRPKMRRSTREYLADYFQENNPGLGQLVERDLGRLWPSW